MTNFDFLLPTPDFSTFAPVAVSAEKLLHIDVDACVLNCRRAMEFAVKWMYSVDRDLVMPYQDSLVSLMNDDRFRDIVGTDIWRRMEFIRKIGNNAATVAKRSRWSRQSCVWKISLFFWIAWLISMRPPTRRGSLTSLS